MKIVSEKTGKEYESVEACMADEKRFDETLIAKENQKKELAAARKARATEIEDAYKAILEAQKVYKEKLNKFVEDYGSFHMTVRTGDGNPFNFFDRLFDWF